MGHVRSPLRLRWRTWACCVRPPLVTGDHSLRRSARSVRSGRGRTRRPPGSRTAARARIRRRLTSAESARSGWDALTNSEHAVAELVAEGMTNREAADRLFVSPHTVNSHLRHVFSKLGINSRVELARVARARRQPRLRDRLIVRCRPATRAGMVRLPNRRNPRTIRCPTRRRPAWPDRADHRRDVGHRPGDGGRARPRRGIGDHSRARCRAGARPSKRSRAPGGQARFAHADLTDPDRARTSRRRARRRRHPGQQRRASPGSGPTRSSTWTPSTRCSPATSAPRIAWSRRSRRGWPRAAAARSSTSAAWPARVGMSRRRRLRGDQGVHGRA